MRITTQYVKRPSPEKPKRLANLSEHGLSNSQISRERDNLHLSYYGLLPAGMDTSMLCESEKAFLCMLWTKAMQGNIHYRYTYHPMHSIHVVRPFFGDEYVAHRDKLVDLGYIQVDHVYEPKKKSKGYRIHERWFEAENVRCNIEGHFATVIRNAKNTDGKDDNDVEAYLRANLRSLKVDVQASMGAIQEWYEAQPASTEAERRTRESKYQCRIASLKRMVHPENRGQVTCAFSRIHGPHTNSSDEIVDHLMSEEGVKAINLDYKNSQPTCLADMLLHFLNDDITEEEYHEQASILAYLAVNGQSRIILGYTRNRITGERWNLKDLQYAYYQVIQDVCLICQRPNGREEIERFAAECQSGLFYEKMAKRMGPAWEEHVIRDRKDFKGKIFGILYGQPWHETKVQEAFKEAFPTISEILFRLKSIEYAALPKYMQRKEALAMQAGPLTLCKERGWRVLSVHDSIMVYERLSQQELEALIDSMRNIYSHMKPQITITNSHPSSPIAQLSPDSLGLPVASQGSPGTYGKAGDARCYQGQPLAQPTICFGRNKGVIGITGLEWLRSAQGAKGSLGMRRLRGPP